MKFKGSVPRRHAGEKNLLEDNFFQLELIETRQKGRHFLTLDTLLQNENAVPAVQRKIVSDHAEIVLQYFIFATIQE